MKGAVVVVSDDRFGSYEIERSVFDGHGIDLVVLDGEQENERRRALREADALLVNQYRLDREAIELLDRCLVISRYGTGYDNVDVDAATRRGIWVSRVPDYCHEEVADHALSLLLACARNLKVIDRRVSAGEWNIHAGLSMHRIAGTTLGIVGYGWTGRALHRKAAGLGFGRVLICDHRLERDGSVAQPREDRRERSDGSRDGLHSAGSSALSAPGSLVSLQELLRESDFISLHIPLRPENRHLIDRQAIASMKPGVIFINTSRGGVVDQEALVAALASGRIASAGLDVFEGEPPVADTLLRSLDNVMLSDHCAYFSIEALTELKEKAARNVLEVLRGGEPVYPVNRPQPGRSGISRLSSEELLKGR